MTTRSQKTALAEIEKQIEDVIEEGIRGFKHTALTAFLYNQMIEFSILIRDHNLTRELLLPILQKYYDSLMKIGKRRAAAIIAKGYKL